jgi:hypothetical protein
MAVPKKRNSAKNTANPSLSSSETKYTISKKDIEEMNKKVFDAINEIELQKSLDKWLKENRQHQQVAMRDLSMLKAIIGEYLDSFILFGYNIEGERVILQNFNKAKDRDALMEFLKIVFIKQQQENFLDE